MSRAASTLLGAAVLAFAAPAAAQIAEVSAEVGAIEAGYNQCIDRSNGTNPAWGVCGAARIAQADDLLNRVWRRVYERFYPEARPALLVEQRAWIAYKEASCLWNLEGFGREGQVVHYPVCRAAVIEDRALALAQLLADD